MRANFFLEINEYVDKNGMGKETTVFQSVCVCVCLGGGECMCMRARASVYVCQCNITKLHHNY